jgi:predicted DNA-binding protein
MTVTLELKPEVEERVEAQARESGLSVKDYLEKRVEEMVSDLEPQLAKTSQERVRLWDEWLSSHDYIEAPPLSDEAISRESLYREREDKQL